MKIAILIPWTAWHPLYSIDAMRATEGYRRFPYSHFTPAHELLALAMLSLFGLKAPLSLLRS